MDKVVTVFGLVCLAGLLYTLRKRKRPNLYLRISFTHDSITFKSKCMAVSFFPGQTVTGTLQAVDRKGNPASVEAGTAVFTSSDEAVFTVTQDPENELKVTLTAVGEGVAQLNYEADADLDFGDGETKLISGFAAVEVQREEAVGFGIAFDAPVDPAV